MRIPQHRIPKRNAVFAVSSRIIRKHRIAAFAVFAVSLKHPRNTIAIPYKVITNEVLNTAPEASTLVLALTAEQLEGFFLPQLFRDNAHAAIVYSSTMIDQRIGQRL